MRLHDSVRLENGEPMFGVLEYISSGTWSNHPKANSVRF